MTAQSLIILDRDGVINQDSDQYIKTVNEWIPIEGSIEAIAQLSQAGHKVVVATNQSGIGRGYFDLSILHAMHDKMHRLVQDQGGCIFQVVFCPHKPDQGCACRKPKPGLIHTLLSIMEEPFKKVIMVGDSLRDLQAAKASGVIPALVRTGKGKKTEAMLSSYGLTNCAVFDNLLEFAKKGV